MENHRVYHHIENGGRQWVALGNPSLSAEGCTVVTSHSCHHPQPLPLLSEEAACQAVVLIPKGGGDYRGIGLVEVIWKAVAMILNICFIATITYHDFLHGFRSVCGTGTATLEVNLLQ